MTRQNQTKNTTAPAYTMDDLRNDVDAWQDGRVGFYPGPGGLLETLQRVATAPIAMVENLDRWRRPLAEAMRESHAETSDLA